MKSPGNKPTALACHPTKEEKQNLGANLSFLVKLVFSSLLTEQTDRQSSGSNV
jgi:hypothetical protein